MSANSKGGLTAPGPSFADKAKMAMRRPTPDSDAVASSDDDHDHVHQPLARHFPVAAGTRRPSTGWLQDIQPNRKFSLPSGSLTGVGSVQGAGSSNPATPSADQSQQTRTSASSFPWNTSSFAAAPQAASRLKEVVSSPTSGLAHDSKVGESDEGIGFLLNQQNPNPVRKAVRSQSYSIGQADIENSPIGQFSSRLRSSLRHRPSKPSLLGEGLAQLREDENDEVSSNGSDQGVRLPAGYWEREQKQALLKQAAEQNARARHRAASTASPGLPPKDTEEHEQPMLTLTRRFSEHVGITHELKSETDSIINPWGTAPMAAAAYNDGLGRRHSFATYGSHTPVFHPPTFTYNEEDEEVVSPHQAVAVESPPEQEHTFDPAAYFTGYGPASRAINASAISAAHPDPIAQQAPAIIGNPYTVPPVLGRPGRRLFVVTFKCQRADIYYLYDNTGLEIRAGDLVMVEGDRGCDLGQVSHADITLDEAKRFKAEALDEHFRWLVMFSQYSLAGAKEPGMLGALARANGYPNMNRSTLVSMGGQGEQDTKPKMIKRLAQQHEINALKEKEGSEAKAKRLGAQKAVEHKLPMEILDAEFQADYHKLTFFYYAEAYVNFNPLVTDIFKAYKIRIWMSAVNPASVVNPAGLQQMQPPSAIGPGAITHSRRGNPPAPVGPGFGTGQYRQEERAGRQQFQPWQMASYQQQPQSYSPYSYGGYQVPAVTAAGTPVNYGNYYPPGSYAGYDPALNAAFQGMGFGNQQ